ncbi:MAG: hypothetical protein E3J46_05855 [Desulfobacteraceae bacterium]|nr:MAG: hypothetical protein E3J46_05855 [Desulfobacteraceae bacterium]
MIEQLRLQFPDTKWIPITAHVRLEQIVLDDSRRLLDALYAISSWGIYFKDRMGDLESMLRRFFASLNKEPKPQLQAIPEEVDGETFVTGDSGLYSEILRNCD